MRLPAIQGVIERRLLVNYRARRDVVKRFLPRPFEPILIDGWSLVGICLIRLREVRPVCMPLRCGIRSENAAHRIAVRWKEDGGWREGVYIPRRDSSSRFNALVGGRLFPGVHNRAEFHVTENGDEYQVEMRSRDGSGSVAVRGRQVTEWPRGSVFASVDEASEFFARGSLGYSATRSQGVYDGLELRCRTWSVAPVAVDSVRSSFFEDAERFPWGTVEFDCALLMRDVAHEWHGRGSMCCEREEAVAAA